ncbi:hypothetical protein LT493_14910 [Streptomyces tricolor]|nr:hypothetical protein [Streptomyces tricolor]
MFHDARDAHAHAEQPAGVGLSGGEDLGDAVADVAGDEVGVVPPAGSAGVRLGPVR